MTWGKVLEYYIDQTGISRAELARRLGVSRSQVTDWINGRTNQPKLRRAYDVAKALGVPLQDMLDMMYGDED